MTRTRIFCAPLLLLALAAHASAQAPTVTQTPDPAATPTPAPGEAKAARVPRGESDPLVEQRRMQAVSMLTSLANDDAIFRDKALRARVQARAADALWGANAILARILFRRAWSAAEAADREAKGKIDEEVKAQLARGATAATPPRRPSCAQRS